MNEGTLKVVLVPGAWMGEWVWEPTVDSLVNRGFNATTMTLLGLGEVEGPADSARVTLEDHVDQLMGLVASAESPVLLVSHSYSSMVTAQVADRLDHSVVGLVHFGGFLPKDGYSLLDGWGSSAQERQQEKLDIKRAGELWMPPTRAMLDHEHDLDADKRDALARRLTPHPGRTVTDPARMNRPVAVQPTTYVAMSGAGREQAWRDAPAVLRDTPSWTFRHLPSGHWPMLSRPAQVVELLEEEILRYSR